MFRSRYFLFSFIALILAVLAPPTHAQETTASLPIADEIWTDELRQLRAASDAAQEYAETNNGVGILIHVGQDIPNEHFPSVDHFGRVMVALFKERHGTNAQYFFWQNDARATGVTYHIGTFIHGGDDGTEVKNVQEALDVMVEVVEYLKIANSG